MCIRDRDKIMGFSLRGIHKDELNMLLGEFPIKKEGPLVTIIKIKGIYVAYKVNQLPVVFLLRSAANSKTGPAFIKGSQRYNCLLYTSGNADSGLSFMHRLRFERTLRISTRRYLASSAASW